MCTTNMTKLNSGDIPLLQSFDSLTGDYEVPISQFAVDKEILELKMQVALL